MGPARPFPYQPEPIAHRVSRYARHRADAWREKKEEEEKKEKENEEKKKEQENEEKKEFLAAMAQLAYKQLKAKQAEMVKEEEEKVEKENQEAAFEKAWREEAARRLQRIQEASKGGTHPRTEEDDEETDAELCVICRDFDCQCPPVFVEALEAFRSP